MRQNITKLSAAVLMVSAITGAAHAGGFSRGTADTDIIYEDGQFDIRGGVLYVNPQQRYDTVGGAEATDSAYSDSYVVPSFALKANIYDRLSCAFTYTQPFGADSTYGPGTIAKNKADAPGTNVSTGTHFTSNEVGGTCGINTDMGPGKAWLIGGVFQQTFDYREDVVAGAFGWKPATLTLKDSGALGYRIGAAYEIPEYKLRGELLYRSAVDHDATGTFSVPGLLPVPKATVGSGTLPQSLSLKMQSGVAPGWLVFGSVTWTDWSVLPSLNYTVKDIGASSKKFNFQDGWTVTAGVGHAFTDDVAGSLSLTWDRGVGTGAFIMTDTWTLATGIQAKAGPGTLRLGGALSYLDSGEQTKANGAKYNATVGNDWSYAVGASYLVKF